LRWAFCRRRRRWPKAYEREEIGGVGANAAASERTKVKDES